MDWGSILYETTSSDLLQNLQNASEGAGIASMIVERAEY